MVIVAYILQDDSTLSIFGFTFLSLNDNLPPQINFNRLIIIFIGKGLWCAAISYAAIFILKIVSSWALIEKGFPVLRILSHLLFAFGILGIFGGGRFEELKSLNSFWYYASIVWGFFCITLSREGGDEGAT